MALTLPFLLLALPASFIRFIYNRIILENAVIRASAVAALAKFGAQVPSLRPSIIMLLSRCQVPRHSLVAAETSLRVTLHVQTVFLPGAVCRHRKRLLYPCVVLCYFLWGVLLRTGRRRRRGARSCYAAPADAALAR